MFIWDSATAFVLVLALVYFGSFAWIEIRDRRRRRLAGTNAQQVEAEPAGTTSQAETSHAGRISKKRGTVVTR